MRKYTKIFVFYAPQTGTKGMEMVTFPHDWRAVNPATRNTPKKVF